MSDQLDFYKKLARKQEDRASRYRRRLTEADQALTWAIETLTITAHALERVQHNTSTALEGGSLTRFPGRFLCVDHAADAAGM